MTLRWCYNLQTAFREIRMDQSSRFTEHLRMFQRSYLYRPHLLCFRRWYQWDGGFLFAALNRYQRKSSSLTGAKVWNNIGRNSTEPTTRPGRVQRWQRKRTWRKETSHVQVETTFGTVPTRPPVFGCSTRKYNVNAMKVDLFYSIGGQSQYQVLVYLVQNGTTISCV